jgi:hypothetical protein
MLGFFQSALISSALGYNWAALFVGKINAETWLSRVGESQNWDRKHGHEFSGTQTRETLHWRGPAKSEHYRPDLSSERVLHMNKPETVLK